MQFNLLFFYVMNDKSSGFVIGQSKSLFIVWDIFISFLAILPCIARFTNQFRSVIKDLLMNVLILRNILYL